MKLGNPRDTKRVSNHAIYSKVKITVGTTQGGRSKEILSRLELKN